MSLRAGQLVLALPVYPRLRKTPVVGTIEHNTPRMDDPTDVAHVFVATMEETRIQICLRKSVEPIQSHCPSTRYPEWVAMMLQDRRLELTRDGHTGHYLVYCEEPKYAYAIRLEDMQVTILTPAEVKQLARQQKQ